MALRMYVIYDKPRDFPHSFVVRAWTIGDGDILPDDLPFVIAPTLAAARSTLPPGLSRLLRLPEDDPVIVESWI